MTLISKLRFSALLLASAAVLFTTGCANTFFADHSPTSPIAGAHFSGRLHGGQQPVSGSTIQLYSVSTAGYGAAATPLLSPAVMTDANGAFDITSQYTCAANSMVYLTATGGNPGLTQPTNNAALAMMAALGSCSYLQANASTIFINMNEVTTVAAAWSLNRFMTSPTNAGTSSGNLAGLANAFAAANKIVDLTKGSAPGPALPAGATLPIAEINTLGNILAPCINSNGSTAAGTACAKLFAAATPAGGAVPADTLTAALNIAANAGNNVAALFALTNAQAPFQPSLATAPGNWLIGIHYVGGGLNAPKSMAVDANGNVWLANTGANTVSEFDTTGAALSPAGGYTAASLSGPSGIAIDVAGNAWVTNSTGASVTRLGPLGSTSAAFTGGGLNGPSAISIDGVGNVWVTNKVNSSVTELSSTGLALSPANGYTGAGISAPIGVAVNSQ